MVEQERPDRLTEILKATSDPTRREVLTILVQHGVMRVTDLAGYFDISLNSVSKHIKILEKAGLVSRKTSWREHLIEANLEPIREIDHWFTQLRSVWDVRLETLDELITKDSSDD
ncbi:ArsR/SmtB family transcription factor [Sulfitobacter sp. MF3-043]|uniref:ArsR/SmtB family transcription factor n=1 Tax=Sulfitobacter sediminivivens TaxID=3252902 RepID=UPI0036DD83F6